MQINKTNFTDSELYTIMYHAEHNENAFVCYLRGKLCQTSKEFLREISSAMRFPFYFGWNWNALDECITDLEWLKFTSLYIIIDNYDFVFCKEDPCNDYNSYLLDLLNRTRDYWISQNVPTTICLNTVPTRNGGWTGARN